MCVRVGAHACALEGRERVCVLVRRSCVCACGCGRACERGYVRVGAYACALEGAGSRVCLRARICASMYDLPYLTI